MKIRLNEFIFIGSGDFGEMMSREYGKIFVYNIEDD